MAGKAFLSHSSVDKRLVREVFDLLGDRLAEIDDTTFEGGLPNWDVIVRALHRSEIFVLFATPDALSSSWVRSEVREAQRRLKNSKLKRILIFSLGGTQLEDFPESLRSFAIFLTLSRPSTIARAIQRHLLELDSLSRNSEDDFVGRDGELAALKKALLNPAVKVAGLSVSGLALLGRARIVDRCLKDLYPAMYSPQRVIDFQIFQSCADIALDLYGSVNELISPEKISELRDTFKSDDASSCGTNLVGLIRELYKDHQYVIFSDRGGIINHRGEFTNIANSMIEAATATGKLCLFFITQRRPVARARSKHQQIVFLDIEPLGEEAARQYVVQKARIRGVPLNNDEVSDIVKIGRGHPQNYDFILEKCGQYPPASVALTDLDDIYEVNRERSRAILDTIDFSPNAKRLLSVLRHYFNIPAEFVSDLFDGPAEGAEACAELLDLHVIIESHGIYSISPPLVDAIDRDRRLNMSAKFSSIVARRFVDALKEYRDDGKVPVNIIDAAGIATIEDGETGGTWTKQFVLPSHYIYLARHSYNRGQYKKAIEYAESAISYRSSLTNAAYIQACRTLGMSAARLGDEFRVTKAAGLLSSLNEAYAKASAHFIRGFSNRLAGDFRFAEQEFLQAKPTLKEDISLDRELAIVYILLRDYDKALAYGEGALSRAPDSPYLLDVVAKALLGKTREWASVEHELRLRDVLRRLQRVGSGSKMSFLQLRLADQMLTAGDLDGALRHAEDAVTNTPDLAAPYLIRSRIHLARGRIKEARADRDIAKARTHAGLGRYRFYDAELLRVEIEIALRSKRWKEAVTSYWALHQFGVTDSEEVARKIADGIRTDRTTLEPELRDFARDHR